MHCPGMAEAHLLLAEAHHLAGHHAVAMSKVADLLQRNPGLLPGHLLLTRIELSQVCLHSRLCSTVPVMQSLYTMCFCPGVKSTETKSELDCMLLQDCRLCSMRIVL